MKKIAIMRENTKKVPKTSKKTLREGKVIKVPIPNIEIKINMRRISTPETNMINLININTRMNLKPRTTEKNVTTRQMKDL